MSHQPVRSIAELAAEFRVTATWLKAFMAKHNDFPAACIDTRGKSACKYYPLAAMCRWWATKQEYRT